MSGTRGTGGIGGGDATPLLDAGRVGEGDRNVRSVIEPELFCRWRGIPRPRLGGLAALPFDEFEFCLCSIRLV